MLPWGKPAQWLLLTIHDSDAPLGYNCHLHKHKEDEKMLSKASGGIVGVFFPPYAWTTQCLLAKQLSSMVIIIDNTYLK